MRNRGFTLIELLITVATVGLIGLGIAAGAGGGCQAGDTASEARAWSEGLGMPVKTVSCIGADNDGDGYVSCTIILTDPTAQPMFVECVGAWGWGEGCRAPTPSMRQ